MNRAGPSTRGNDNKFAVQLKHKKCCVIQQTRTQMSNLENRYDDAGNTGSQIRRNDLRSRLRRYWRFIRENKCCITMILFVLFMAWFCIMIGVLIGATSCTNSKILSPLIHFKIPGLSWGEENSKCWKVF